MIVFGGVSAHGSVLNAEYVDPDKMHISAIRLNMAALVRGVVGPAAPRRTCRASDAFIR